MDAEILAPLGPLVAIEHARERRPGAIGVLWRGGRAVAVNAYRAGLAALPGNLGELSGLVRLDVGENELTALPALPAGLRELYVHDNQLAELPALPALEVLDANRNRLSGLPALADLAFVYLAGNRIAELPALARIGYLNIGQNPLGRLALADDELRELRVEQAALTHVALRPALRELSLRGNELTTLALHAPRLDTLDLRGNQLDTLPAEIRSLPLRKLDLRWNPLRAAPAWLDDLAARGCLVYR